MNIYLYVILFAIFGIPLFGFVVHNMIKFGKYAYSNSPFIRKFFDDYGENYGIGFIISLIALIVYSVLRWLNFV